MFYFARVSSDPKSVSSLLHAACCQLRFRTALQIAAVEDSETKLIYFRVELINLLKRISCIRFVRALSPLEVFGVLLDES